MRRRILVIYGAVIAVIGAGVVALLWWQGWFSPSPAAVIKDAIESANAGDFERATRDIVTPRRELYNKEPDLRDATWNAITRYGTIKEVEILEQKQFGSAVMQVKYSIR